MYCLILTMVILIYFMINQTIKVYVRKLKIFNTMLLWPLLVPSKVHLRVSPSGGDWGDPLPALPKKLACPSMSAHCFAPKMLIL